ncbi:hypothetical protein [Terriglobus sp. RCC_193]|uniref:hypothetical protein n=1 Tax=Terriglobus sp. RCC_193 TaxID=3239218 RepID=UPI00352376B4
MSRLEVTRWHIGKPARVNIEPRDKRRLGLLWLRIASQHGGRRMGEIGELMAEALGIDAPLGHAVAWTVYLSLNSHHLADSTALIAQTEQLRYFATELGRALIAEADQEAA